MRISMWCVFHSWSMRWEAWSKWRSFPSTWWSLVNPEVLLREGHCHHHHCWCHHCHHHCLWSPPPPSLLLLPHGLSLSVWPLVSVFRFLSFFKFCVVCDSFALVFSCIPSVLVCCSFGAFLFSLFVSCLFIFISPHTQAFLAARRCLRWGTLHMESCVCLFIFLVYVVKSTSNSQLRKENNSQIDC